MKQKIILLIKMLALSLAFILLYTVVNKQFIDKEHKSDSSKTSYSFAMGTSVSITVYGLNEIDQTKICEKLENTIQDLDKNVISWREENSELGILNHSYKVGKNYELSDELYVALILASRVCEQTKGALDISIRPLALLWNIEEGTEDSFIIPTDSSILETLSKVDYTNIEFDEQQHTVALEQEDMILDLGAVGKGYALDIVREELKKAGVPGATISVGGSILVYGEKGKGEIFRVGIRNPKGDMEDMIGYLEFPSGSSLCVSTSGDYEKYIEKDGKIFHHILDSKTGYPVENNLSSVTVVCENGLYSDALSTACYVLGEEASIDVLKHFDAEAIFIDKNNNISVTPGLKENWVAK